MSYFYSHLIEIESLTVKLDELELSDDQRSHLATLVDSTIHQIVLDIIFSRLSDSDKIAFMEKLKDDPKDKRIMEFINSKTDNIEKEIMDTVHKLKKDLHKDIDESKRSK